jgi:hypothetical protein
MAASLSKNTTFLPRNVQKHSVPSERVLRVAFCSLPGHLFVGDLDDRLLDAMDEDDLTSGEASSYAGIAPVTASTSCRRVSYVVPEALSTASAPNVLAGDGSQFCMRSSAKFVVRRDR